VTPAEAAENVVHGATVVTITPFDAEGGLDLDALGQLVERLAESPVDAITVNGNTGEFASLAPSEAQAVAATAIAAASARRPVIVGVGGALPVAVDAAAHAAAGGASLLMVHEPLHPYRSLAGWIEYHRQIASAAPDLGLVLYVRDATVDSSTLKLLRESCDSIIGVKYAVADPLRLARLVREHPTLGWSCGLAETWAPLFWTAGARGFTTGIGNIAPELPAALLAALRRRDDDETIWQLWAQAAPFERIRTEDGGAANVTAIKEALLHRGELRSATVRPPLSAASTARRAEIGAIIDRWGAEMRGGMVTAGRSGP
jgi:4-hydroxy-tetrahydrodipicolinate synthase